MVRKKKRSSVIRRLHRSLGAGAAVFVIFMVLSGMIINHSNSLGLDQRHVSQPSLLDWYGLREPESIQSYTAGSNWLSFAGSQLYLDDKYIATISDGVGAVSSGDLVIAAGADELLLLDQDGNMVERLPWEPGNPSPIESIGRTDNELVVVKSGGQLWMTDENFLSWQPTGNLIVNMNWSSSTPTPDSLKQAITQMYRSEGLSMERLLLDLHSGRIFGPAGIFIYDLLALALGFLSISGLILWFRSRHNGKSKRRK